MQDADGRGGDAEVDEHVDGVDDVHVGVDGADGVV